MISDVDSGARKVATPATSRLQIELRKPSSSAGVSTQVLPAKEVVEDVVESSKDRAVKKEQAEGSAVLMAGGEDSGGAIEGPMFPSKEQGAESVEKEVVVIVKEEEKMGFVNDEGEKGTISKNIEPFSVKETEGVAMESEVSKGVYSLRNDTSFSQIWDLEVGVLPQGGFSRVVYSLRHLYGPCETMWCRKKALSPFSHSSLVLISLVSSVTL